MERKPLRKIRVLNFVLAAWAAAGALASAQDLENQTFDAGPNAVGPRFVWDVAISCQINCYLEDPARPGHGRAESRPVESWRCKNSPATYVVDIDGWGVVGCFLADLRDPRFRRDGSCAVAQNLCDWKKARYVLDVAIDGSVHCYLEDPRRPGYGRPGCKPVPRENCP